METRAPLSHPGPDPGPDRTGPPQGFLAWFPWEKLLIWALFLLVVYVLRHFFFIIFMTFMLSYIMIGVVRRVTRMLSPHEERAWLQRTVAVAAFALLLGFLYGVGTFLYHPLKSQADGLVSYARNLTVNYESIFKNFLGKTIGAWRFETEYRGKDGQERLARELEEFKETKYSQHVYEDFRNSASEVEKLFRTRLVDEEGQRRHQALREQGREREALELWMLENVDEPRFAERREEILKRWEDQNGAALLYATRKFTGERRPSYEEYLSSPEFQAEREVELKKLFVSRELESDREEKFLSGFKADLGGREFERLRKEGRLEDRFRRFYEEQKPPAALGPHRYEFNRFKELLAADSKDAFEALISGETLTSEEKEKRIQEEFRATRQNELAEAAVRDLEFLQIENIRRSLAEKLPELTRVITGVGLNLFELVVQFALSLLLSFFITFDLPRLRRGIRSLEQSRARDFYHEIAPGLISFGRLIGRAFQAQGVIALCNTLLTFLSIRFLGIQNEVFLSSIVFICSFIPVVGVVISSVPIALMAIIQPGGDIKLAMLAVLAILVIHFIETSILNPKIVGDMLHLHPVMVLGILAVGEYFFGVWGLLLGVPVAVYIFRYVILAQDPHPVKLGTAPSFTPKEKEVVRT